MFWVFKIFFTRILTYTFLFGVQSYSLSQILSIHLQAGKKKQGYKKHWKSQLFNLLCNKFRGGNFVIVVYIVFLFKSISTQFHLVMMHYI